MKRRATLREMLRERAIDTSSLDGWVNGQRVTILAVLENTAVYYFKDKYDQKFLESLEKIEVTRSKVAYLPERIIPDRSKGRKV